MIERQILSLNLDKRIVERIPKNRSEFVETGLIFVVNEYITNPVFRQRFNTLKRMRRVSTRD